MTNYRIMRFSLRITALNQDTLTLVLNMYLIMLTNRPEQNTVAPYVTFFLTKLEIVCNNLLYEYTLTRAKWLLRSFTIKTKQKCKDLQLLCRPS